MKDDLSETTRVAETESRSYAAPALEKGLDILEMLCRSEEPLSQKDIAHRLGRSVGEIYRMISCLVNRNYVAQVDEGYYGITTKLFELSHINPPTHRLLFEMKNRFNDAPSKSTRRSKARSRPSEPAGTNPFPVFRCAASLP